MIICPDCLGELLAEPYANGIMTYWRCASCGGLAIPPVLSRKLQGEDFHRDLVASAKAALGIGKRPCPICSNYLKETEIGESVGRLKAAVCLSCQTAWFGPESAGFLASALNAPSRETLRPNVQPLDAQAPAPSPPVQPSSQASREQPAAAASDPTGYRPLYTAEQQEKIAALYAGTVADQHRLQHYENPNVPEKWWQKVLPFIGVPVVVRDEELARTPLATWMTVLIIVAFSLAAFRAGLYNVVPRLAFLPADPLRAFGLTFLTSFLLHGSYSHLLGNLYFLVVFGMYVEERLGGWFFAALLAASSLAGDMMQAALGPNPNIYLIGASGGIAGLITFFCLSFPKAKVIIVLFFHWIKLSAWFWVIFWLGQQLLGVRLQVVGATNVSHLGHLGGALVGVVFWLAWMYGDRREAAKE